MMSRSEIQKRIDDLILELKRLRQENRDLKAENEILKARLTASEATIEAAEKTIEQVSAEVEAKTEELAKANEEIVRLNATINMDSSNSSRPPSQDGYRKPPRPIHNSREKSGRKRGGQHGHPGHRLGLPENLDELVEQGVVQKELVDLTGGAEEYVTRYTIDISIKTVVTEYRYPVGQVPPERNNEVTYGDTIKTLAVLFTDEGMISGDRLSGIFNDITKGVINISEATINNFRSEFVDKSGGEINAIKADITDGKIINTDDTTMRSAQRMVYGKGDEDPVLETAVNKSFKVYVRTYSNDRSTYQTVNPGKGKDGIERDGILPNCNNILCHDHDKKIYGYGKKHGTCGEHLVRELKGLNESWKIEWAGGMRAFMLRMNAHKNQDLAYGKTACDEEVLAGFEREYDELVKEGREVLRELENAGEKMRHNELRPRVKRLEEYKDSYMLFMRDYDVPFTNNLAERDLRPDKTKQKISGCFRSWEGIKDYVVIRSLISTFKKRGIGLLESISNIFKGVPVLY